MTSHPDDDVPRAVYVPSPHGGPAGHWAIYTDAAGRIAALLAGERDRASQQAAAAQTAQAGVDRLTRRLAAQRHHLTQLAANLRLPAPHFGAITPSPITDPAEALHHATAAANTADTHAQAAHRQAAEPPLLPGLTPLSRNTLVYAAAAFLGTIASILMFSVSPDTELGRIPWQLVPWSLCGFPALAFFAAYLTISLVGQPRIGDKHTRSARVGGVICFIGMPIMWFIFIAATRG